MMSAKSMGERLTLARKAAGFTSAADAARALGISYPTYAAHENASRGFHSVVAQYARRFSVSADWLLTGRGIGPGGVSESLDSDKLDAIDGPVSLSGKRVSYGGVVRAGGFLAVDDFDQDDGDHLVPSSVVWNDLFPKVRQFGWRVRGTSMDEVGIFDGMWIVAAPYLDFVETYGEPVNGTPVVVERTRHGGSEIERTLKELQFNRNGMRLVPRSSDPAHKEVFVPRDYDADSDEVTVAIIAVVLSVIRVFSPRDVSDRTAKPAAR